MWSFLQNYPYLVVDILLCIPWAVIFVARKDLHKEMLIAGTLGAVAAFTDILYIPEYWSPDFIFGPLVLGQDHLRLGISLEDALFGFFLAGIASVIYESLRKEGLYHRHKLHRHWVALLVFALLFFGLEFLFPGYTIYSHVTALVAGALVVVWQRKDLLPQILTASLVLTVGYGFLFKMLDWLYQGIMHATRYNPHNLSGLYVFHIPVEELLFPFGVGLFGSAIYEYLVGLATRKKVIVKS